MKKLIIIVIVLLVIVGTAIVCFSVFFKPAASGELQFAKLAIGDIRNTVTCTGTLEFTDQRNIVPRTSGTVAAVYVDFNAKVKKGRLLAAIDDTLLVLSVSEARTSLDKANADLVSAKKILDDTTTLFDKGFKSQSDLDTARNACQTAVTAAETAKLALDRAQINLRYARITAPISGIIVERNIDVGQQVSSGSETPAFVIAADTKTMRAFASVDENDISKVAVGQKVTFSVQSYQDANFEGKVSQVRLVPTVAQNVVNYTVVVDVNNRDGKLMPGMTATMDIVIEERTGVVRIPQAALRFTATPEMYRAALADRNRGESGGQGNDGGNSRGGSGNGEGNGAGTNGRAWNSQGGRRNGNTIWVLDEARKKVKPVRVKPGITDGQWTESITDTLTEGMQVVVGFATKQQSSSTGQNRSPFQPQRGGFGPVRH
jgi:HlyD family secretion protein